jgi:hypothetical protein
MMTWKLYLSTTPNKKYDIYVPTNTGHKKISFGDNRYLDYTMHKDIKRRDRYRVRHINDNLNNVYSPGFWSWYVLWNKPDLNESLHDAVRLAKSMI